MGYPINGLDSFPTPRTDHTRWIGQCSVWVPSFWVPHIVSGLGLSIDGSEAPVTGSVNSIGELLLAGVWFIKRLGLKQSRAGRHVLPSSEAKPAVAIRLWTESDVRSHHHQPRACGPRVSHILIGQLSTTAPLRDLTPLPSLYMPRVQDD
ncbi:hypothetical protein PanWU01x14_253440 [Parasponia andersonii]|uniref:Uncharacterized protein n=1 Tax=Parasponia andersonii TaxID=3476 RepID=A0A2P5BBR0_PARAD|nr:hypothetical protein PanWU01x14_253440 [Parasponia andersonii]